MVRRYEDSDFEQIDSWWFQRTGAHLEKDLLPDTGWIIPYAGCGFLYLTNSKVVYLDIFATNPDCSRELRHEAIQLIIDTIVAYAKELNFKMLICETKYQVMKEFAIKNDCQYTGILSSFSRRL